MIGVLIYILYLLAGLYISAILLNRLGLLDRITIGFGMGIVISMWMPTIGAMIIGRFTVLSNIIGIALTVVLVVLTYIYNTRRDRVCIADDIKKSDWKKSIPVAVVIVPFIILMIILFDGHVLKQSADGLYGGQSTYGDLPMHLGMITSIFTQGKFPPDYSILPGTRLSYPFLVNLQSATMCIFGTSLRMSVIIPSVVMSLSCFLGVFALAKSFVKKNTTAALAFCLFFITGGLGFMYFLDSKELFMEIFTGFYKTPTNNMDYNLRWVNIICDMMIPQRTFLAGLSIVAPAILLLKRALSEKNNRMMLLAGVIACSLPMIHTHSFLALGILCSGLLICDLIVADTAIIDTAKKWGIYLIPVILLAAPQLLFWVFTQTEGFVRLHFDWVNEDNNFLWFWIKNIGLVFILIIPAVIRANKEIRIWFLSSTLIFVLAEILVFQPNTYDNNKLMIVWYIFVCILCADYLLYLFNKAKNITGRVYFAVITLIVLFLSGGLTIAREVNSNGQYLHFKTSQVETAEAISASTDADALFLTGRQHVNAISSLSGRNIYAGSTLYLYFHGLDYDIRYSEMEKMYEDTEYAKEKLIEEGIDYVYISSYEWNDFEIDVNIYQEYPLVYSNSEITIVAVSEEAISRGAFVSGS